MAAFASRAMPAPVTPKDILDFWTAAGPDRWFRKNEGFDAQIRQRFADARNSAVAGELDSWMDSAEGALALIILIDQFSRNLFRGSARTFEGDAKALRLAELAVERKFDAAFADNPLRSFFYMPFMHAEDEASQQRCIALFEADGDQDSLKYAREHADIIARFGRFPHRNVLLGRATTPAECRFLEDGGFAG